jgi:hypothetical protein
MFSNLPSLEERSQNIRSDLDEKWFRSGDTDMPSIPDISRFTGTG